MFKIEHFFLSGWEDAGWIETGADDADRPSRFATLEAANQAIDEFIADSVAAHAAGDLSAAYDRAEFRAVTVE